MMILTEKIKVRLPPHMKAALVSIAAKRGHSLSVVMREVLTHYTQERERERWRGLHDALACDGKDNQQRPWWEGDDLPEPPITVL